MKSIDFTKAASEFLKIADIEKFISRKNILKYASMSPLEKVAVAHRVDDIPDLEESMWGLGYSIFLKRAEHTMIESGLRDLKSLKKRS